MRKTFDPYGQPRFALQNPTQEFVVKEEVWEGGHTMNCDDEVEIEPGLVLTVEYIGNDEYSEDRQVELSLKRVSTQVNENYEADRRAYNTAYTKYLADLAAWNEEKRIFDTNKEKQIEHEERKELERLKRKYEGK